MSTGMDGYVEHLKAENVALKAKLAAAESACREALKLFQLGVKAESDMTSAKAGIKASTQAVEIERRIRAVLAGEGEART